MVIAGHRGASVHAPENTIASIKMAFKDGAVGAEFDIQKSKDGKLFVLHDDTLERTANPQCPKSLCGKMTQKEYTANLKKDISELSYVDFIRHVDVGSWKDKKYADQTPPLMKDVMALVPKGKFVLCEVKGGDIKTADEVVAQTKEHGWKKEVLRFIGFDDKVMSRISSLLAKEKLKGYDIIYVQDAYKEDKALKDIEKAKKLGFTGVDFEASTNVATPKVVEAAHKAGLIIGVWVWKDLKDSDTAKNVDAFNKYTDKLDFFTSDLPDDVKKKL